MPAPKRKTELPTHPDLLTPEQAAAYLGIARLDQLPVEWRPNPMPYNRRFYHRQVLDQIIERAARQASAKAGTRLAS